MSRYVVGLTGGIAAGKSEVTRRFEALGIVVADADLAARAVVAPGAPALARIAERFGADMLLADGTLDRARLRAHIFADPAERTALEAITHPAIRLLMQHPGQKDRVRPDGRLFVHQAGGEVVGLVETGLCFIPAVKFLKQDRGVDVRIAQFPVHIVDQVRGEPIEKGPAHLLASRRQVERLPELAGIRRQISHV